MYVTYSIPSHLIPEEIDRILLSINIYARSHSPSHTHDIEWHVDLRR